MTVWRVRSRARISPALKQRAHGKSPSARSYCRDCQLELMSLGVGMGAWAGYVRHHAPLSDLTWAMPASVLA